MGRRMENDPERRWVTALSDDDLAFLKRFLLLSGTLKDLAKQYGISYPTVRLRLDRLIAKIKVFDSHHAMSDFERTVRARRAVPNSPHHPPQPPGHHRDALGCDGPGSAR